MNARLQWLIAGVAAPAVMLGSASCGNVARTGRSPSILVVDSLQGASGAAPGTVGVPLESDVLTLVKKSVAGEEVLVPTVFNDLGEMRVRAVLKNPGSQSAPSVPSVLNAITISQYHVAFVRSDGRNIPGVDVPYAFDGGVTATVGDSASVVPIELVRSNAKQEAPLRALAGGGGRLIISAIAQVTLYGQDLAGNDVQATGSITVNFSDFGDPD
jgi:hypothetical protein